jgi:hypothetical protein
MSEPKIGFEMRKFPVALADILPLRKVEGAEKTMHRYKTILTSIREVGLVEPLVVHPQKGAKGKFLLLDGHQRFAALKELGEQKAECVVAKDDERYTYNARVSRLPAVQEHRMIVKAVRNGVKPERIAAALNMPARVVMASMRLLDGIHEEAADMLKDKNISGKAIRLLKRVTGMRQIEMVEVMMSANNYSSSYVEALILGTPKDQLVNPDESKQREGMSAEEIARMEEEMVSLERDLKAIEDSYGENVLNLTLARGFIKRLLENGKVLRYLNANHADILKELEGIAAAELG